MKRISKVDSSIVKILTISIQISQFCVLYSSLLNYKREHFKNILNYRFLIINYIEDVPYIRRKGSIIEYCLRIVIFNV